VNAAHFPLGQPFGTNHKIDLWTAHAIQGPAMLSSWLLSCLQAKVCPGLLDLLDLLDLLGQYQLPTPAVSLRQDVSNPMLTAVRVSKRVHGVDMGV
jgi:hypothetical protein